MKINIKFENEEKCHMITSLLNAGILKSNEVVDEDEHIAGSFGEMKYNHLENEIVYDLKPAFIKATTGLMVACINIIKSLISTYEMYTESWLKDAKDLIAEKKREDLKAE